MWRNRDREHFIGAYDPEHELPDPDRRPGDRWQSDAYRQSARDSRYAYRMNPDRFEDRFGNRSDVDREMRERWERDARDRDLGYRRDFGDSDRPFSPGRFDDYGRGRDYGSDYARNRYSGGRDLDRGRDRGWDREPLRGSRTDHDRFYGSDRGWDAERERHRDRDRERAQYEDYFGSRERDRDGRRR